MTPYRTRTIHRLRPAFFLLLAGALIFGAACSDDDPLEGPGSEVETAVSGTPREGTPAATTVTGTPQQGSESAVCSAVNELEQSISRLTTISGLDDAQQVLSDVGQDLGDVGTALRNSDSPELQQLDEDFEHFKDTIAGLDEQPSTRDALSALAESGRQLITSFINARNAFNCP